MDENKLEELKENKMDLETALEVVNPITNPYSSAVLQKELVKLSTEIKRLREVYE
jgi:hypothetical protein